MEEKVKNNYTIGIIGSLIGALVGSIPWVLMYIFANMMYAILAIVIVLCSYYGYKITKAKIDKKFPVIISISSFIAITITMFIIIPICMMVQNGVKISVETFQFLYSNNEFFNAISTDYLISLLFSLVVISGIIINLNKQIKAGVDSENIKLIYNEVENNSYSKEDIEIVKEAFEKNEAMDKKHTITKELIIEELVRKFDEKKARGIFNYLKVQNIVKKKSGRYYFSEKAQKSVLYRYGISNLKTFIIILLISTILAGIIVFSEQKQQEKMNLDNGSQIRSYELGVDGLKLELPEDMTILSDEQINYYFGKEYVQMYDCLAVSKDFSKMIMVFSEDKTEENKKQTAEEYIKEAVKDEDITINEQKIGENIFYNVEFTYKNNGVEYASDNYVYDAGDRFVCIIFDSLKNNKINLDDIIVIKNK